MEEIQNVTTIGVKTKLKGTEPRIETRIETRNNRIETRNNRIETRNNRIENEKKGNKIKVQIEKGMKSPNRNGKEKSK